MDGKVSNGQAFCALVMPFYILSTMRWANLICVVKLSKKVGEGRIKEWCFIYSMADRIPIQLRQERGKGGKVGKKNGALFSLWQTAYQFSSGQREVKGGRSDKRMVLYLLCGRPHTNSAPARER
jgi:hypothetical protein